MGLRDYVFNFQQVIKVLKNALAFMKTSVSINKIG